MGFVMKYDGICDVVLLSLGLPDTDKPRLLQQLNILRNDIAGETDWQFLRRVVRDVAFSAGSPVAVPAGKIGVTLVKGASIIYYHVLEGLVPPNLGLRYWSWDVPADSPFVPALSLWGSDGAAVVDTVSVYYWVGLADLTAETVATVDVEFPATAAFVSGLTARWLRYEERSPEAAAPPEAQFAIDLREMVSRNPVAISIGQVARGGLVLKPGDR